MKSSRALLATSGFVNLWLRLGWAAMLAVAVNFSVYAQQPEPDAAAPAESDRRDDTAGKSTTELAKEIQNPIADLISFPFQNNANFNFGPLKGTQDILNIQPVIPIHLNEDWNLITRTIFPLIWQPALAAGTGATFGLGNVNVSLFLSPKEPFHGIIWGVGPVIVPPTATSSKVGSNIWGAGPTAVALRIRARRRPRGHQQCLVFCRNLGTGRRRQRLQQFSAAALDRAVANGASAIGQRDGAGICDVKRH